jgi:uncharacterized protein YutE (UPF0331/DUF86 family)
MNSLNKEKIITLTSQAKKAIAALKEYARLPAAEVLGNLERVGNMKYQFIIAIEACIDICQHVSAKMFSEAPESYASCFAILREKRILEQPLADELGELARLRNVLVHLYWKVDDERVVENLQKLDALESFLRTIQNLL